MKSIIEEASSILKAIEKAWTRAGNPREFSVKIFEDPQTSFFGLTTTKQAKVGVFFEIVPLPVEGLQRQGQKEDQRHSRKPERPMHAHPREQVAPVLQHRTQQPASEAGQQQQSPAPERKKPVAWNDDMLTAVSKWLNDLLQISNLGSFQPTLTVLDSRLII